MIEVPWQQLSELALAGVIEEFIHREGTDYGERELSLEEKTESLMTQLKRGDIKLVYDPANESCTLVDKKWASKERLEEEKRMSSN